MYRKHKIISAVYVSISKPHGLTQLLHGCRFCTFILLLVNSAAVLLHILVPHYMNFNLSTRCAKDFRSEQTKKNAACIIQNLSGCSSVFEIFGQNVFFHAILEWKLEQTLSPVLEYLTVVRSLKQYKVGAKRTNNRKNIYQRPEFKSVKPLNNAPFAFVKLVLCALYVLPTLKMSKKADPCSWVKVVYYFTSSSSPPNSSSSY